MNCLDIRRFGNLSFRLLQSKETFSIIVFIDVIIMDDGYP